MVFFFTNKRCDFGFNLMFIFMLLTERSVFFLAGTKKNEANSGSNRALRNYWTCCTACKCFFFFETWGFTNFSAGKLTIGTLVLASMPLALLIFFYFLFVVENHFVNLNKKVSDFWMLHLMELIGIPLHSSILWVFY